MRKRAMHDEDVDPYEPPGLGALEGSRGTGGFSRAFCISARTGEGTAELVKKIAEILGRESRRVTLLLPYDKAGVVDTLRREAAVLSLEYGETGVTVEAVVKPELWGLVREYVQNDSPKE